MLKVIFINKGLIISEHDLILDDAFMNRYQITKFQGSELIIIFKHFFDLDINQYRLSDMTIKQGEITIFINDKDLEEMRNKKLNSILDK